MVAAIPRAEGYTMSSLLFSDASHAANKELLDRQMGPAHVLLALVAKLARNPIGDTYLAAQVDPCIDAYKSNLPLLAPLGEEPYPDDNALSVPFTAVDVGEEFLTEYPVVADLVAAANDFNGYFQKLPGAYTATGSYAAINSGSVAFTRTLPPAQTWRCRILLFASAPLLSVLGVRVSASETPQGVTRLQGSAFGVPLVPELLGALSTFGASSLAGLGSNVPYSVEYLIDTHATNAGDYTVEAARTAGVGSCTIAERSYVEWTRIA